MTIVLTICGCSTNDSNISSYIGFDVPKLNIDRYLTEKMESLGIPGMSIAFINNGKVSYHKTYGYADVQNVIPVNDQTIFEAA